MDDRYIRFHEMGRYEFPFPSTPAGAASRAAAQLGVQLGAPAAEAIAAAVLASNDGIHQVCILVAPEFWPQGRDVAHKRLTIELAEDMAENGWIPTDLPQIDVRDDPTDVAAPQVYRRLMVTMWVPYRRPRHPGRPGRLSTFGLTD
jgi:hypothetical protein